jgi:hypothetical protein
MMFQFKVEKTLELKNDEQKDIHSSSSNARQVTNLEFSNQRLVYLLLHQTLKVKRHMFSRVQKM